MMGSLLFALAVAACLALVSAQATTEAPEIDCPEFDVEACFNTSDQCFSQYHYYGCEFCVCTPEVDPHQMIMAILGHLYNQAAHTIFFADDLKNQIFQFVVMLNSPPPPPMMSPTDTTATYRRALREVRLARKAEQN